MSTQNTSAAPPITLMALITKKKELTWDEFSEYWRISHARLVAPWLEKRGVLKYRQIHLSRDSDAVINGDSAGVLDSEHNTGGVEVFQCDGILELELPSFQTWIDLMKDPYYADVVVHDERKFFDAKKVVMGIGSSVVPVENGKARI
ncbi:hypothetical protein K432DRAFT_294062 [Lepidopterella palustris CBS 459.81]|uniref:EthD domain-containing protein n=1 Tax=Lepidopterella palustris CBS 459.81 TaxID=1314670 RepID=A0A8E2EDK8_9PEZI|nr:hypothetical protein K432DRAFT_294062 [Lepidopterella palustris CBS 459.81]